MPVTKSSHYVRHIKEFEFFKEKFCFIFDLVETQIIHATIFVVVVERKKGKATPGGRERFLIIFVSGSLPSH